MPDFTALDPFLAELDAVAKTGPQATLADRTRHMRFEAPEKGWPFGTRSPFSEDYARVAVKMFEHIHLQGSYDIAHEGFTTGHNIDEPFPFYMSPDQAGYWTMIYGHLLYKLKPKPKASVLEIGFGPGGLTEVLARSGLRVTALDAQASYCDFIKARLAQVGKTANVVCMDATNFEPKEPFDAIIFFESLHHVVDHYRLVSRLCKHLTPGGALVLGAEPIFTDDDWALPFPWGPRLHPRAVYAMRQRGWMELGFRASYLTEIFALLGLKVERHYVPGYHHSLVWIGRRP